MFFYLNSLLYYAQKKSYQKYGGSWRRFCFGQYGYASQNDLFQRITLIRSLQVWAPNGMIEYKGNAYNGALKGKLLVCRFSGGNDILVLEPGGTSKNIVRATEGIKIPGY